MAKKQYAFYPGCSSQKGASASNFLTSIKVMTEKLDIQLNEIPDWNCCGASIGYAEGGELPRLVLNARNLALTEQNMPGMDMVSGCPACWLSSRETAERLQEHSSLLAETNEALKEAGLNLKSHVRARHMTEVLIEDIGYAAMKAPVIQASQHTEPTGISRYSKPAFSAACTTRSHKSGDPGTWASGAP